MQQMFRWEHVLVLTLEFIQMRGTKNISDTKSCIWVSSFSSHFQPSRRLHEGRNLLPPISHRLLLRSIEDDHHVDDNDNDGCQKMITLLVFRADGIRVGERGGDLLTDLESTGRLDLLTCLIKSSFQQNPICDDIGHLEHLRYIAHKAFMDTPDSSVNVREGGLASQIIETVIISILLFLIIIILNYLFLRQTFFEEFESPCDHGFFNRGDLEDPVVAECVQRGIDLTIDFITQYVVNNWKFKTNGFIQNFIMVAFDWNLWKLKGSRQIGPLMSTPTNKASYFPWGSTCHLGKCLKPFRIVELIG